jgi:type IV pilus assembly protein PilA
MVVVLIIAILIAIAIPTFLGARQRAQDRAAQSNLRNALTAEKTVYTDTQEYDATTATMQGVESSLNWNGVDPARAATTVTVGPVLAVAGQVVCITETAKSGTVFSIADVASGVSAGTYMSKGGTCADLTPATLANATWNTGW